MHRPYPDGGRFIPRVAPSHPTVDEPLTGYMHAMTDSPTDAAEPRPGRHKKDADPSDPALDDGDSADWTSEGGATPEGPATAAEADNE